MALFNQTNTCGMISGDESWRTQSPQASKLLLLFHTNLIHAWHSLNPSLLIQLWNAWLRNNTTEQTTRGMWRAHRMPLPWRRMHLRSQSLCPCRYCWDTSLLQCDTAWKLEKWV